jgi:hypothetical protein
MGQTENATAGAPSPLGTPRSDILARNYYTGHLLLFRHSGRLDGRRTFEEPVIVSTNFSSRTVDWLGVGDFTGEGTDVVAVTSDGRSVLYPLDELMRMSEPCVGFDLRCDLTHTRYHTLVVADIDSDGQADIVGREAGDGNVVAMVNESTGGSFAMAPPKKLATMTNTDYFVGMADVTGTGRPDLVVSRLKGIIAAYEFSPGQGSRPGSILSSADGGLWYPLIEVAGGIRIVAVTDVDGDGWPDILGVRSDGALLAYQHGGVFWPQDPMATYLDPVVIGTGWDEFDIIA